MFYFYYYISSIIYIQSMQYTLRTVFSLEVTFHSFVLSRAGVQKWP